MLELQLHDLWTTVKRAGKDIRGGDQSIKIIMLWSEQGADYLNQWGLVNEAEESYEMKMCSSHTC